MSERLYYTDAYTTRFTARIAERVRRDGQLALLFDGTYFYPASGGQPSDRGSINGHSVAEITIRESDEAILHWLGEGASITAEEVEAEIDWNRRFDHMQQHSGQHILSQAFLRVAGAQTVSFHLSDSSITIDLDQAEISPSQAEAVELLANRIVWENRPVHIRMVAADEIGELPMRKPPPTQSSKLRLIDIDDFDLSACGGTHVSATGEIGTIKITKLERRGEQLRVSFCCGLRALQDYGNKNSIVNQLAADLTTGHSEIVSAVDRLREEHKQVRRELKKQQNELLRYQAEALLEKGKHLGGANIITHVLVQHDPGQLRTLANQLTQHDGVVALLGLAGPKSFLLFSRSKDGSGDMNRLLQGALPTLGPNAGGGGNASHAQGGGPAADRERVVQAIEQAERLLIEEL